jgi:hypothetical protein
MKTRRLSRDTPLLANAMIASSPQDNGDPRARRHTRCTKAVGMERGQIRMFGDIETVLTAYTETVNAGA